MDAAGTLIVGVIIFAVIYLFSVINILREYERAVVFRLGKLLPTPKGPGIILIFRPLDKMVRVSLRQGETEIERHPEIAPIRIPLEVSR